MLEVENTRLVFGTVRVIRLISVVNSGVSRLLIRLASRINILAFFRQSLSFPLPALCKPKWERDYYSDCKSIVGMQFMFEGCRVVGQPFWTCLSRTLGLDSGQQIGYATSSKHPSFEALPASRIVEVDLVSENMKIAPVIRTTDELDVH
jgi:hypothetical protein